MRALRAMVTVAMVIGMLVVPAAAGALPAAPDPTEWTVQNDNGAAVFAIAATPTGNFIGGRFNYLGPRTGHALLTSPVSGDQRSGWPTFNDDVMDAKPDASGGAYVAGLFTNLGGTGISYLAHIKADGTIDEAFNPAPNARVTSLAVVDGTVFAGGWFTTIGGQARQELAKLSATTGAADPSWNPAPTDVPADIAAASDGTVYAVGYFPMIGGVAGLSMAEIDSAGSVTHGWMTDYRPTAVAVSSDDASVYVAGSFGQIKVAGGSYLTKHSIARVFPSGQVASWDAGATGGDVQALLPKADGSLYVAGTFTSIGNLGSTRHGLAQIAGTGSGTVAASSWDPDPEGRLTIDSLSTYGPNALADGPGATVFVGGDFTRVGGVERNGAVQLDDVTGLPTGWDPDVSDPAYAFAVLGDGDVIVGGDFIAARGVNRTDVAFLDTRGVPTAFDARITTALGAVTALAYAPGGPLWIGGHFSAIQGVAVGGLTAVDPVSGDRAGAVPQLSGGGGDATALVLDPAANALYVGGDFGAIGGQPRSNLGAISTTARTVTSFAPNPNSAVEALQLGLPGSGLLYAGGVFMTIGAQALQPTRAGVAALETATGNATPFDAHATGGISALGLAPDGSTLYLGSASMSTVGGLPRNDAAAVSTTTGLPTAYDPEPNSYVWSIAVDTGHVYLGGDFTQVGGQIAHGFADTDPTTGALRPADLLAAGYPLSVRTIASYSVPGGKALALGGQFSLPSSPGQSAYAQFRDPDPAPPAITPSTPADTPAPPAAALIPTPTIAPLDTTAPVLSAASLTHTRFKASAKATAVAAAKAKRTVTPTGTQLRFTLSEPAKVTIVITQAVNGRRSGKRCVTGRKTGKRCTITRTLGTLTRGKGVRGANRVAFSGRIAKKKLKAGTYKITLNATDAAGNKAKPRKLTFTLVS